MKPNIVERVIGSPAALAAIAASVASSLPVGAERVIDSAYTPHAEKLNADAVDARRAALAPGEKVLVELPGGQRWMLCGRVPSDNLTRQQRRAQGGASGRAAYRAMSAADRRARRQERTASRAPWEAGKW